MASKRVWTIELASIRQRGATGYIVIWEMGRSNGVLSWEMYSKSEAERKAQELNDAERSES